MIDEAITETQRGQWRQREEDGTMYFYFSLQLLLPISLIYVQQFY